MCIRDSHNTKFKREKKGKPNMYDSKSILSSLSPSTRNTLQSKLSDVELVIMDECSMIGSNLFHNSNCRMNEIFETPNAYFGNKSVLLFGNFQQLRPIGDRYIF